MKFSDFMKTYLYSRSLENRKDTDFSEYLLLYGNDPRPAYDKTIAGAREAYLRSMPDYGQQANALERAGLLNSGYAGFLRQENERTLREKENAAGEIYADALAKEATDYRDYLDKAETENETLRKKLEARLLSMNTTDSEAAYAYLVAGGLSDEDARATAETVVALVSQKKRSEVLETALHYGYDYKTALSYARAEGLTEEDAITVAKLSEEAFQHGGSLYAYFKEHFKAEP